MLFINRKTRGLPREREAARPQHTPRSDLLVDITCAEIALRVHQDTWQMIRLIDKSRSTMYMRIRNHNAAQIKAAILPISSLDDLLLNITSIVNP